MGDVCGVAGLGKRWGVEFSRRKGIQENRFQGGDCFEFSPKWFSFTLGGEGFLLGIMNVFGLVPNSGKKKPQGCIQLAEVICKLSLLPWL